MNNQISLRTFFIITAVIAVLIACFQNLPKGVIFAAILAMLMMVTITFTLFGVAFLFILPFAQLSKYLNDQTDAGSSPFAQDRLPTQIIPPIDRGNE